MYSFKNTVIIILKHPEVYGNIAETRQLITYVFRFIEIWSKIINNTNISGIIDAETAVLLKYLSNFVRALEIPLKIVKLILF